MVETLFVVCCLTVGCKSARSWRKDDKTTAKKLCRWLAGAVKQLKHLGEWGRLCLKDYTDEAEALGSVHAWAVQSQPMARG
jgi:hypothetical protein